MKNINEKSNDKKRKKLLIESKLLCFSQLKIIMILYLTVSGFYLNSQNTQTQGINSSLNSDSYIGILKLDDRIVDKYIPPPRRMTNVNNRDVTINVNFNGAWTTQAQDAFLFAVQIWEDLLTSPVTIEVDATFVTLPGGVIGRSFRPDLFRNFTSTDPEYLTDTWYVAALANKLSGTDQNGGGEELELEFNNTIPFYFGTDGSCPTTEIDFVTVVLHELGHGLGLTPSTVQQLDGDLIYGVNGDPISYDRFVIDGTGTRLTDFATGTPSIPLDNFLQSNDLFWDSGSEANGSRLFAPVIWNPGSSISHLDEVTFNPTINSLMTPFLAWGEAIHNPGPIALAMLDDIGWDIDNINDPKINVSISIDYSGCNNNIEYVSAIVSGGIPPYSYRWSTGAFTPSIANVAPGTYSLTVSDDVNNFEVQTIIIEPRIVIQNNYPNWSDIITQYNLNSYLLMNRSIYIEQDLIMDVNYTFTNVTFGFAEGARMIIQDDVTVFIDSYQENKSVLKACDLDWHGIKLESGANLVGNNIEILDATTGVLATDNSYLKLNNVLVQGNSGNVGIDLTGDVECSSFGLTINNYCTGVKGSNNSRVPHFSATTVNNSDNGFIFNNSPVIIGLSSTESRISSITLDNCPGSLLALNIFRSGQRGIVADNSPNLAIKNPVCESFLTNAIELTNCSDAAITDVLNSTEIYNIKAIDYGIKATNCLKLEISGNEIQIQGSDVSHGIQLTDCNQSTAFGNKFLLGSNKMGIETINGSNNAISNNTFEYSSGSVFPIARAAVIRTQGGVFETIDNNIINGPGMLSGIHAINSSGNTYSCNNLSSIFDGLGIYYNSTFHDIKGNDFLNCATDLKIRSVIGPQYYKGNEFYNGNCNAEGLNSTEIGQSKFFVNKNIPYHMPSNPIPGNEQWFRHQPVNEYYDDCPEDDPRGGRTGFDDERILSDHFDRLKLERSVSPERFFVNMMHLLEYDYAREDYSLPRYITEDPVWLQLLDWTELAEAINSLSGISKLSGQSALNQNDLDSISMLQKAYVEAAEEATRELIYTQLAELMVRLSPAFDQESMIDSLEMDQLKNQFRSFSGRNDQMVERWADIYTMYIDFLQKGEVAETNKAALLAYSRECADKYGDAIHLARSMANTFDKTYFDVFDDCPEEIRPRAASNTLNAIVQPNPTKGELNIVMENPFTGTIEMFDITGKLVYSDRCENIFEKTIHLNLNEGVFMMKITSLEGESDIEKVIVTK